MRHLLIAMLLIAALTLPGCNGCGTPEIVESNKPVQKGLQTPAPATTPEPAKKEETAKATMKDAEEALAEVKKMNEDLPKRDLTADDLKKYVPMLIDQVNSDEFRSKLEKASKEKNFKQVILALMEAQVEVCRKNGIRFEDFASAMNKHRDDPEVQKLMDEWRKSLEDFHPKTMN